MKNIRTILAVLLMAAAVFTLCACTGGNENTDTTDAQKTEDTTKADTTEAVEIGFTVKVVDPEGNPVAGVTVQVCDDSNCFLSTSNDKGEATYTTAQVSYVTTSHKISVPFLPTGYVYTGEAEVYLESGITEYTVTVEPAE